MKMSRHYKLFVTATEITEQQLFKICSEQYCWNGKTYCWSNEVNFEGDGRLCGGQSELAAHEEICAAIKKINPKAKINTQWTNMEELPYEEYGDRIY